MIEYTLLILFFALILDWFFGEPEFIWSRIPHPIVLFGKAIGFLDDEYNYALADERYKEKAGALAIFGLLIAAIFIALVIKYLIGFLGYFELIIELILVFILLAQRSLYDHVQAVATGLRSEGIEGGRKTVAMIVGRDPENLDQEGVAKASIETLAENFSDGVVAPAFWYAALGLPGLFAYKMINTADSMVGHRTEKHLHFGRTAAQLDDLANWLPARLSSILIAIATLFAKGFSAFKHSIRIMFQDSGMHRSPNAGWPEAAMAGALDVALGGPRIYAEEAVQQSHLNSGGKQDLGTKDIEDALNVYSFACLSLTVCVFVIWIIA